MLSKSWLLLTNSRDFPSPERDVPENKTHNYHVSSVRIRSEHCVGFLKGRWSSLRGLRVQIANENDIQYAALWITTCIHLHAYAMIHEQQEGRKFSKDRFLREGRKYMRRQREMEREWRESEEGRVAQLEMERDQASEIALLEGKLKREELKEELLKYLQ